MKSFLKYLWNDSKVFWIFIVIFILIFHVGGALFSDMEWRDIFPMYVLFGALGSTIVGYSYKKWKAQRDKDDESTINNTHL